MNLSTILLLTLASLLYSMPSHANRDRVTNAYPNNSAPDCERFYPGVIPLLKNATCKVHSLDPKDRTQSVELQCDVGNGMVMEKLYIAKSTYVKMKTQNSADLISEIEKVYPEGKCKNWYTSDLEKSDLKLRPKKSDQ